MKQKNLLIVSITLALVLLAALVAYLVYRTDRANIPILDGESRLTYYLICKAAERPKWELFFRKLDAAQA